tara:strand:- start:10482 stop:11183 length:702 start_codon:yes stop_codon:yes gene_type:complete
MGYFKNSIGFIKTISVIMVIIIVLFLFKDWLRTKIITSLGGYTKQETSITIDSTYVIGKVDTLAVFNKYIKTKGIIINPKTTVIYKYRYTSPDTKIKVVIDSVKVFNVKVKDSVIDGNIQVVNNSVGELVSVDLEYIPLIPKLLRRIDTVYKTTKITEILSNERAKIGIGIGVDTQFQNLDLLGSYTFKNDWQIIYEYSNPIKDFNANVPQLNFENVTFPRTGTHSIKLIKNF